MSETQKPTATAASSSGVATLDAWKQAKTHVITLPSNVKVEIQIPDLPSLAKTGVIPNELIDVALGLTKGEDLTADDLKKQADFYNKLVALTVVNPEVTEEEVAAGVLPSEDKEHIVEFATRQRDVDVLGHQLAGLERVREWRTFRGVQHVYEDLESESGGSPSVPKG